MARDDFSVLDLRKQHQTTGFSSPVEDHAEPALDIRDLLVRHPVATYYVRMSGESRAKEGIHDRDILIVDRALTPRRGHLVVVVQDDELIVRLYEPGMLRADAEMPRELVVWGVVTFAIHRVKP